MLRNRGVTLGLLMGLLLTAAVACSDAPDTIEPPPAGAGGGSAGKAAGAGGKAGAAAGKGGGQDAGAEDAG